MFETVINSIDKFGPEILVIQSGFLVILSTLFLWLWFSNRRKYHNLKHAIPANVVKSYLDSIIQNSTALKSSLFRGGGLEVGAIPSVMPLQNLMGGDGLAISGAPSTALLEELNQKKAMINSLEAQLSSLQNAHREVEGKLLNADKGLPVDDGKIKELEKEIARLKALASQAPSGGAGGGNDDALKKEIKDVSKERDEYRDRLKEFEIISDDLANLKRLQQENEQLKRSLASGGGMPAQAVSKPEVNVNSLLEDIGSIDKSAAKSDAADKVFEDFMEEKSSSEEASASSSSSEADAPEESQSKSEKTPEDLLSEFEKMLG